MRKRTGKTVHEPLPTLKTSPLGSGLLRPGSSATYAEPDWTQCRTWRGAEWVARGKKVATTLATNGGWKQGTPGRTGEAARASSYARRLEAVSAHARVGTHTCVDTSKPGACPRLSLASTYSGLMAAEGRAKAAA